MKKLFLRALVSIIVVLFITVLASLLGPEMMGKKIIATGGVVLVTVVAAAVILYIGASVNLILVIFISFLISVLAGIIVIVAGLAGNIGVIDFGSALVAIGIVLLNSAFATDVRKSLMIKFILVVVFGLLSGGASLAILWYVPELF